jgi:hypothetical protein
MAADKTPALTIGPGKPRRRFLFLSGRFRLECFKDAEQTAGFQFSPTGC